MVDDRENRIITVFRNPAEPASAFFSRCADQPTANASCVIDGGHFWYHGKRITVVGMVAPRLKDANCPAEREAGEAAATRLAMFLSDGWFELIEIRSKHPQPDHIDQKRVLERRGVSFAATLIGEGLASRSGIFTRSWC
jgi:micrococcal nuclease